MAAEMLVLRLLHVMGGMVWVGFAVYNAFFLIPSFAEAGPAAGAIMGGLQKRKLFVIMPIVATVVIVTGIRLLMIISGNFGAAFFETRMGLGFTAGGVLGLLSFVFGLLFTRPAMEKVAALSAKRAAAPAAEHAALDAQLGHARAVGARWSGIVTWGVIVAAVLMSVARYL